MSFEYSDSLWSYILPDGPAFCHWGGKRSSKKIIDKLNSKEGDKVLDYCSGQGGTLKILSNEKNIKPYAIDNSELAIKKLKESIPDSIAVKTDGFSIGFKDSYFDAVFSEDPDIFLHKDKQDAFNEVYRVCKKGSLFILQTYVQTRKIPLFHQKKIDKILLSLGYSHRNVCYEDEIVSNLQDSGFSIIEIIDLHRVYSSDNKLMIKKYLENENVIYEKFPKVNRIIKKLLFHEKILFDNHYWEGLMVIAKK